MEIDKTCEHCKTEFRVKYKQRDKKYCCRACYIQSGIKGKSKNDEIRETRQCINCGNNFTVKKKQPNKLCSQECRVEWGRKNAKERTKKSYDISLSKNNGIHFFKTKEFKEKADKTKIEKYGTTNHMLVPEIRERFFNSIENISQEQWGEIIKARENTKMLKYGDAHYNNREKFINTLKERYGGHHLRLPEFYEKCKKTNVERYGVESLLMIKSYYNNVHDGLINKFNGYFVCTEEYKEKIIEKRFSLLTERFKNTNFKLVNVIDMNYVQLQCKTCGNVFAATQLHKEYVETRIKCRKCEPIANTNSLNIFFESILNENNIKYSQNDKKTITPLELDYILNDYPICFELNGNYYHSQIHGSKGRNYHINKTKNSYEKNLKLIHIFEDEIKFKGDIVKSRILNLLGLTITKIYARKCEIRDVNKNTTSEFMNINHIQGNSIDKVRYGLYYNNELVSLMTFGGKRKVLGNNLQSNEWELVRFANKLNTNVIGGFSKLLKHFIKKHQPTKILTYADIRWSGIDPKGTVYHSNGFEFISNTKPNYWYVSKKNFLKRLHRFTYRKDLLVKEGNDITLTEWEIMQKNGYDRIWDCGSMKFEWKPNGII